MLKLMAGSFFTLIFNVRESQMAIKGCGETNLFDHEQQDLVEDSAAGDFHRGIQVLFLITQMAGDPVCLQAIDLR